MMHFLIGGATGIAIYMALQWLFECEHCEDYD